MKAVGYIRVSTEKQATEGDSLGYQEQKVKQYCQFKGIELIDILRDEGKSGGKNKGREGFEIILDRIEANGIGCIVVNSLERLSRDALTLMLFERLLSESDIELHTADGAIDTSTPEGYLNFAMQALMGEFQRRTISHKTKEVLRFKKENGEAVGRLRYGYKRKTVTRNGKKVKILVEVSAEQEVIRLANEVYQQTGHVSDAVKALNEAGYRTRAKKLWDNISVTRMITNYEPVYQSNSKLAPILKNTILNIA